MTQPKAAAPEVFDCRAAGYGEHQPEAALGRYQLLAAGFGEKADLCYPMPIQIAQESTMDANGNVADPSEWDPKLDAVTAAPDHHKVLFENDKLRVLEVALEPMDEEPLHHHRWPSVFVLDEVHDGIRDYSPEGEELPPSRDIMKAIDAWDGKSSLVVHMAPQPLGRVLNKGDTTVHGIRVEIKG